MAVKKEHDVDGKMFLENYSDKALARIYNNNVERAIKSFKGTVLFLYLFSFLYLFFSYYIVARPVECT